LNGCVIKIMKKDLDIDYFLPASKYLRKNFCIVLIFLCF
jgi:hypothetical protein